MARRAARRDANQPEIVAALRAIGAWVFPLHTVGRGFPDVLVYFRRQFFLLEIKTRGGRLTPDQQQWHKEHPGAATIVEDVDDALRAIGAIRGERATA